MFSQAILQTPGLDVQTGYGTTIGQATWEYSSNDPWGNVYLDQFTGRLIDALYGIPQSPGNKHLVAAIDTVFGSQHNALVSEIVEEALINLGMHAWKPQNDLVQEGLLEVLRKQFLLGKCHEVGSLYKELVKAFVVETLGTDLRIPKPTGSGFGPVKVVDRNNVAALALKLGRKPHQTEKVVILAAVNRHLRDVVDEVFLPTRTWQI